MAVFSPHIWEKKESLCHFLKRRFFYKISQNLPITKKELTQITPVICPGWITWCLLQWNLSNMFPLFFPCRILRLVQSKVPRVSSAFCSFRIQQSLSYRIKRCFSQRILTKYFPQFAASGCYSAFYDRTYLNLPKCLSYSIKRCLSQRNFSKRTYLNVSRILLLQDSMLLLSIELT